MGRKPVIHKGYDNAIIDFVTSQKKSTQRTYKAFFNHILDFTKMSGSQILESKKADKEYEWEKKVISFKQYMKSKGLSDNSANTAVNTLRSFFDYYRTPLLFSQNENRKLNGKAKRVTADYMLSNEDLTKMAFVANLREKYVVLLGKSFGLRAGDFITLTYGTFRSINLETEPPISIGEIQTEKEGVPAFPFIDSDALPVVKAILEANKDKPNNERIITVRDEELSTIMQNLAVKANINLGGKHLRFHCFRKYLSDRLSSNAGSESKWKQIIGKAISEDAYVSSLDLRQAYINTMKLTTIYTNGNGKVSKLSEDVAKLKEEREKDRQTIEELKTKVDKFEQLTELMDVDDREKLLMIFEAVLQNRDKNRLDYLVEITKPPKTEGNQTGRRYLTMKERQTLNPPEEKKE